MIYDTKDQRNKFLLSNMEEDESMEGELYRRVREKENAPTNLNTL